MRDDGRGEQKMRMVVNYLALNGLTIVPDFPISRCLLYKLF